MNKLTIVVPRFLEFSSLSWPDAEATVGGSGSAADFGLGMHSLLQQAGDLHPCDQAVHRGLHQFL